MASMVSKAGLMKQSILKMNDTWLVDPHAKLETNLCMVKAEENP
jgi:hypothetical protein